MRKILRAFRVPWPFRQRRHTWLPARDLLDGGLDRARRKPGCALCRLAQEHDQQLMHSFLWEYCTDPAVGAEVSARWGFCPYHSWSLAIWEREHMGDSLGMSMVYHPLLRQCQRVLATVSRHVPVGPEIGSVLCRFCAAAHREETVVLQRLIIRWKRAVESQEQTRWDELHTELCAPHLRQFLQAYGTAVATPRISWFQRAASIPPAVVLFPEHSRLVTSFSEPFSQHIHALQQADADHRSAGMAGAHCPAGRKLRVLTPFVSCRTPAFPASPPVYRTPQSVPESRQPRLPGLRCCFVGLLSGVS